MDIQEILSEYQEHKKISRNEGRRGVENLCKLARGLGYKDTQYFGQFAHDGSMGDLIEFLEDNPGCIEAIKEWIGDHGCQDWHDNLESELPETVCEECGSPLETYMKDQDGTNLEEVHGCPLCD